MSINTKTTLYFETCCIYVYAAVYGDAVVDNRVSTAKNVPFANLLKVDGTFYVT